MRAPVLVGQDVRYAVRMLRRAPIFTATAVLSLALGIGATTTVFTLINSMFRTLPVRDPGRLVELLAKHPTDPRMNGFGWKYYEHYRDHNHVFSDVVGFAPARFQVTADGAAPELIDADYVVGQLFPALGVQPALGRMIGPDDDRVEGGADPAVAVISWQYWESRWQRSPSAIGSRIVLDGVPVTVIGVAPRKFPGLIHGRTPRVWVPTALEPLVQQPSRRLNGDMGLALIARLAPGVTIEQAAAEMRLLDRMRIEEMASRSRDPLWLQSRFDLEPAGNGLSMLRDHMARPLLALMAIVSLLLLIACTNVASMLLARAAARRREIAVRVALGAGRRRLLQQLFTESMLLATAGGAIGVLIASVGSTALARTWPLDPRIRARLDIPVELDLQVLLFSAAMVALAAILFGLAPAWSAFTQDPSPTLRQSGVAGETPSRRWFGKGLVVAQVALSVVLLTGAGLFMGEVLALRSRDLGFSHDSVLLMTVDPARSGYTRQQLAPLYDDVLTRLRTIPGVEAATLCELTPIQLGAASRFVSVDGFVEPAEARRYISLNWVAPSYFDVVRTPLVAGRDFTQQEAGGQRVAIVNQTFARYYFGARTALGGRFTFEGQPNVYEIVGIAGDSKYSSIHEPPPRMIYLHALQDGRGRHSQFALRTSRPPEAVAGEVRRVTTEVLKTVPIARMTTLSQQVDEGLLPERLMARLSSTIGGFGVLLAAMGIYGLLAFTVARRTSEIALHMALGATHRDAMQMVVAGSLRLVGAGLLIGVPLAIWSRRLAASLVPLSSGVTGPLVLATIAMLLVAVAASYVPARRAARIEPMLALRHD